MVISFLYHFDQQNPPVKPDENIPAKPDQNPDPTRPRPGGNEPQKNDPTRITEPPKTDPTRIDEPSLPKPESFLSTRKIIMS